MLQLLQKNKEWLLPILVMLLIAPFTPSLDLTFSHYFYEQEGGRAFTSHPLFEFLNVYALVPGQILAVFAVLTFIISYFVISLKRWRSHALVLTLTLAVGLGVICHAILKDHWGRPRPKQIVQFGGQQEFRPFYKPNFFHQPEPSKSFPSGHGAMGFYFFSMALIGIRLQKRGIFYLGLALAIFLGVALSLTRIAKGGHFFSDVLMSALIMWLTAFVLDRIVYGPPKKGAAD